MALNKETGEEVRRKDELARNRFATDDGDFSATPAVSNGELFIRSTKRLCCVAASGGGS